MYGLAVAGHVGRHDRLVPAGVREVEDAGGQEGRTDRASEEGHGGDTMSIRLATSPQDEIATTGTRRPSTPSAAKAPSVGNRGPTRSRESAAALNAHPPTPRGPAPAAPRAPTN